MRVVITGGTGFVGRHLAAHCAKRGDDVMVTYRPGGDTHDETATAVDLPKSAQTVALEVTDAGSVSQLMGLLQPDVVYHLAALTFVPEAEGAEAIVSNVNVGGTQAIVSAIKEKSPKTRLVYVSSSEIYGAPRPSALPLRETSELRPANIYGWSKAAADLYCHSAAFRYGLDIVRVRPFPHIGPGQSPRFALSGFAKQLAQVKLGKAEPIIKVGNLEAKRDYTDVSDIVRGYRDAALNARKGESYNFCSGKSFSIGELLQMLIKASGVEVEVVEDPSRLRVSDIPDSYGSADLAQRDFGWKPRIELESALHGLFAFWVEYTHRS